MPMKKPFRAQLLSRPIEHVDITAFDSRPIIDQYRQIRGSGGDLADATEIINKGLQDPGCTMSLTLAGSSSSQGLMNVWPTLVKNRIVDIVLATGASVIDMDIFETLGFRHYHGDPNEDNETLGDFSIDRIYDTYIDEEELKEVDIFCRNFLDTLKPGVYSPRQLLWQMGKFLSENPGRVKKQGGLVQTCFEQGVPLFCLGLTDSAFGMGSTRHQIARTLKGEPYVQIDTSPEYTELAKIKLVSPTTGLLMIGGGIPKNHAQDTIVVAQQILDELRKNGEKDILDRLGYNHEAQEGEVPRHKYAVQITVADPRDGACSSSTLREARTWGKVDLTYEKMVFGEATALVPPLASALYHRGHWKQRPSYRHSDWLTSMKGPSDFGDLEGMLQRIRPASVPVPVK